MTLYQFWSHYLVERFDGTIFDEFRAQAMSDLDRRPPSIAGLQHLAAFYQAILIKGQTSAPLDDVPHLLTDIFRLIQNAALPNEATSHSSETAQLSRLP